tara:strand:- start:228 stop:1229 length:1002 start_codon:yes stop_codon:yes gene_type:complete
MKLDISSLGNAIVDVQFSIEEDFVSKLEEKSIEKGTMTLIDPQDQLDLIELLKQNYGNPQLSCGGAATNSIVAASNFGSKCHLSCKVADDDMGNFYLKDLTTNNVFHTNKPARSSLITGQCVISVTPDAERTMCTYLGISTLLGTNDIDANSIENSKYLFLEGYLVTSESALDACLEAIKIAKDSGTKIAISLSAEAIVNNFKDELCSLLNLGCDMLFCNESEACAFTKKLDVNDAEVLLREFSNKNLITLGKQGSMIWDGVKKDIISGYEAKAIDTNGAGDMFAGSVLNKICEGENLSEAARFGCYASSKQVERFGPRLTPKEYQIIKKEFS